MGRKLREHATGVAFHITARALDHWFTPAVIGRAEQIILDGVASSDAMMLAHIVMPNHFHVVIRSGYRPLGWVMQPIMRRLALLINRTCDRRGPVFEGRFRSRACDDVDHLRRAIIYVHNNALRKRLCTDVFSYPWHSHGWYCGGRPADARFQSVRLGLGLFADNATSDEVELRRHYLEHFAWRVEKDRYDQLGIPFPLREPRAEAGDVVFHQHFVVRPPARVAMRPDVRDRAVALLSRISPDTDLAALRRPYVRRDEARARRELICALLQGGYRGASIATLFRVSAAVVSRCASQMRNAQFETKSMN